jgi:hypothetical protein
MSRRPTTVRTALAKRLARKWLDTNAAPEFRLTVYGEEGKIKNLPGLLRLFRDGKTKLSSSVLSLPDLGIKTQDEKLVLWSKDRAAMASLDQWLLRMGYETTGVW